MSQLQAEAFRTLIMIADSFRHMRPFLATIMSAALWHVVGVIAGAGVIASAAPGPVRRRQRPIFHDREGLTTFFDIKVFAITKEPAVRDAGDFWGQCDFDATA
jgi:hypothetical protein